MSVKVQLGRRDRVRCDLSQTHALLHNDVEEISQSVRLLNQSHMPTQNFFCSSSPASIPKIRRSNNGSAILRLVQRRRVQRSHPQAERRPRDKTAQSDRLQAKRVFPQVVWSYQLLQGKLLSISPRYPCVNIDSESDRRPRRA